MRFFLTGIAFCVALLAGSSAHAETTECTEITSVPITITTQGVYCLKQDLATAITGGNAITIETNNVTIDFNGFKLGGLAAGAETEAKGIYALDRKNITLRGGNIRGFRYGIQLYQDATDGSSGHLIEDNRLDGNTQFGMLIAGSNVTIRNNQVINTDSTVPAETSSGYTPQAGIGTSAIGIAVAYVTNGTVEGNMIFETIALAKAYGVRVTHECSNVRVSNNTIVSVVSTDTNQYAYGIFVGGSSQRIAIHDNTLIDGRAGWEAYGIYNLSGSEIGCFNNNIMNFGGRTAGCAYQTGTLP